MRVHGVAPACKVLQVDDDDIIHLSSQYGPQEAQPIRTRSQPGVGGVRVLPKHGLLVNAANPLRPSLQKHLSVSEAERVHGEMKMKTMCCSDLSSFQSVFD